MHVAQDLDVGDGSLTFDIAFDGDGDIRPAKRLEVRQEGQPKRPEDTSVRVGKLIEGDRNRFGDEGRVGRPNEPGRRIPDPLDLGQVDFGDEVDRPAEVDLRLDE